jgi:hypothetical protein
MKRKKVFSKKFVPMEKEKCTFQAYFLQRNDLAYSNVQGLKL